MGKRLIIDSSEVYYSSYYIFGWINVSFLLDLFPLIIFFGAYKLADIFIATGFLISASLVQLIIFRVRDGKFEKSKLWLFIAIAVFGGITIILHDDFYLKWKVTLVLSALAMAFLLSLYVGKRQPLVKKFFLKIGDGMEKVPDNRWKLVNWIWIIAYSLQAGINHYFAFYQSRDAWVNFKVWGLTASNFIIIIISLIIIFPFIEEPKDDKSIKAQGE